MDYMVDSDTIRTQEAIFITLRWFELDMCKVVPSKTVPGRLSGE